MQRKIKESKSQRTQGYHREAHTINKPWLTVVHRDQEACIYATVYLGPIEGLRTAGTGAISNSFTCFWDPTLHTGSAFPVLIHVEVLPDFINTHGRPAFFWTEEEGIGDGRGNREGTERGEWDR